MPSSDRVPRIESRLHGALLLLTTLLSRLPFRSAYAYHWDSVNFLFALHHFDMLHEQPQPPGYLLYVLAGRFIATLIGDDHQALVLMSLLASGVAVLALYAVGRRLVGEFVGLGAALMLATSPLFWFYGEVALPHTVDTACVLCSLWLLIRVRRDRPTWWKWAVLALAVTGGFRPQTLVFLLPVALYTLWPLGRGKVVQAALLGAFLSLLWAVPLVNFCGGLKAYAHYTAAYSARFMEHTSLLRGAGVRGLLYNARRLTIYTAFALSASALGFPLLGKQMLKRTCPPTWAALARWTLLWATPPLAFYLFIHMGQQGLVFIFLPALLLWAAAGIASARTRRNGLLTIVIALNTLIFLIAPEYPLEPRGPRLLTRETIIHHDADLGYRLQRLQQFIPGSTATIAENWHHLEYYAPDHLLLRLDEAPPNAPATLSPRHWPDGCFGRETLHLQPTSTGEWFIVTFDEGALEGYPPRGEAATRLERITLPDGGQMGFLSLDAEERIAAGTEGWELCP